jgi:DNA-binding NarL/FixJ family response regulator
MTSLEVVAAGGTVIDPQIVRSLLDRSSSPLDTLTPREREVLALMAEGRANPEIARRLVVSDAAVAKHIGNVFAKLGLATDDAGHRRVRAVLAYLRG